jgi:hypothetical protein
MWCIFAGFANSDAEDEELVDGRLSLIEVEPTSGGRIGGEW